MARKAKPQRRKPGSGTIRFKKGRALPWEAAFPIGNSEYRYESFLERSEAEAHLDKLTADRDSKTPRNVTEGSQLVRTFFPRWLATKVKIAPLTRETYQYLLELAAGQIGRYRIDEVTREIATAMLVYFGRNGFQNVEQLRSVCRQAFEYAVDEGWIARNPFIKAEAPDVERRLGLALTETQRARLLDAGATEDHPDAPLCALWHLYSRLGLRRGEGMGVRWQDCDLKDLDKATIVIRQQLTREKNATAPRKTTKTKEARIVPCPRDLAELLIAQRAFQVARVAQTSQFPTYVFTDATGRPLKIDAVQHRWTLLRRRSGMPEGLRIHDLRHTALTILALQGVPDNIRMALAGHKTAAVAGLYANHASVEDIRRALG